MSQDRKDRVITGSASTSGLIQTQFISGSKAITKYINLVSRNNKRTAYEYFFRLKRFEHFFEINYDFSLDEFLTSNDSSKKLDIYEMLNGFVSYLIDKGTYTNGSIKQRVNTARNLLEYYDMEVSPRKLKFKVIIPKPVVKYKEALTKELIINILNNCPTLRLKTFILWLAATGMRAGEACSIRMQDLDFDNRKVFIHGEYTKTKIDRWVFLTKEICEALLSWFEYKYRTRKRYYYYDSERKHYFKLKEPVNFVPAKTETDLIFGFEFENHRRKKPDKIGQEKSQSISILYIASSQQFDKVLDRLGIGYEDATRRRRKITLHSFRRYVKSTISDLGYSDFSEWYIGHAVSTYYRKSDKEKFQLFKRLEESLTYLDQSSLEKKHADVLSRLESSENEVARLKQERKTEHDELMNFMHEIQEGNIRRDKEFEEYKRTHP